MLKIRHVIIVLGLLLSSGASAAVQVSIGINVPTYPQLVLVPGYPVYYAPRLAANYFFYDGLYWVYQEDNWYASSWYNGPWDYMSQDVVPVFVLRVPVRYYRQPPAYFRGWRADAPPRWGDHWGRDWEHRRSGWDRWNRGAPPTAAPLPVYQRQYSRDQYPRQVEQQEIHKQNYRYQPHDPVVRQHYQDQSEQRAPYRQEKSQQKKQEAPDARNSRQDAPPPSRSPSSQKGSKGDQHEQQMPSSQVQEERQQGEDATREPKRGQRTGQEQGRDRNE